MSDEQVTNTLVKRRLQELSGSKQELNGASNENNDELETRTKSDFIKRRVQELGASFTTQDQQQQQQSNGQGQQPKPVQIKLRRGSSASLLDGQEQQPTQGQVQQQPEGTQQQSKGKQSPVQQQTQRTQSPHVQQQERTQSPHQQQQQSQSPQQKKLKEVEDKNIKLQLYIRSPDRKSIGSVEQLFFPNKPEQIRRKSIAGEVCLRPSGQTRSVSLSPQRKETAADQEESETDTSTLPPLPKNPPPPLPSKNTKPPSTKPRKTRRSRAQQQAQHQEEPGEGAQVSEISASPSSSPSKLTQNQQSKETEDKEVAKKNEKRHTPTKQVLRRSPYSPVLQRSTKFQTESPTPSQSQSESPKSNQSPSPTSSQSHKQSPVPSQSPNPAENVVAVGSKSPGITNNQQPEWTRVPPSPSQIRKQQLLQKQKEKQATTENSVVTSKSPELNNNQEIVTSKVPPSPSQIRKQQQLLKKESKSPTEVFVESKSPDFTDTQQSVRAVPLSPSQVRKQQQLQQKERKTPTGKVTLPSKSPELSNNQNAEQTVPALYSYIEKQESIQTRQSESPAKERIVNQEQNQPDQEDEDDEESRLKVSVRERILAAERAAKENQEAERLERERLGHKRRAERLKNTERDRTVSPRPNTAYQAQLTEGEQTAHDKTGQNATTQRTTPVQCDHVEEDKLEVKIKKNKKKEQKELERLERERLEQQRREEELIRQQLEEEERRAALLKEKDQDVLVEVEFDQKKINRLSVSELRQQEEERLNQERSERERLAKEGIERERRQQEDLEKQRLLKENSEREKSEQERLRKEKAEHEQKIQERLERLKLGNKPEPREETETFDERLLFRNQQQPGSDPGEVERLERRQYIESQLRPLQGGQAQASTERVINLSLQQQERLERHQSRKLKYQEEEERISKQKKAAEQQLKVEQDHLEKRIEKQRQAERTKLDQRILEHKRKEQERLGVHKNADSRTTEVNQRDLQEQRLYNSQLEQQLLTNERQLLEMTEQLGDQQLGDQPEDEYEKLLESTRQLEEKQRLVDQMLMEKKKQLEEKRKQLANNRQPSGETVSESTLLTQMTANPKNAYIKKRAEEIIGRSQKPEAAISGKEDEESHVFKPVHPAPVKSIPSAKTRHPSDDIGETIPTAKPVPLPRTSTHSTEQQEDSSDADSHDDEDDSDYDEVLEGDAFQAMMQQSYMDSRFSPEESYLQKAQEILRSPHAPPTHEHSFTYQDEPLSPNGDHTDQHQQHPAPRPEINALQTAGQILSKRITPDDVKNKLMELREQFKKNTLKAEEVVIEPDEPEPVEPEMTSEEVLVALGTRQDDPDVIEDSLSQLQRWLQTGEFTNHSEGLHGVLLSMMKHPGDYRILMLCSSCLLLLMKGENNGNLTDKNRSDMLLALMNCLDNHPNDAALTRRCCCCLEQFDIPYDMLLDIDRVVQILVRIVTPPHDNKFSKLQCIEMAMNLLDKLSLPHPDLNKPFEANLGALSVHAMLEIIEDRLQSQVCDVVMENAWSVLWNVTHDTPENCVRFMTSSGLNLFLDCIKVFHDRAQLHVSMCGLMINLAEAKYVRNQLMKSEAAEVIATIWEFMNNEDTQLSYCSCSVMARLVADGTASWKMSSPTHTDTCERIVQSIASWNMNISGALYRGCSLQPILRLVTMTSSPEAQYWAAWTICSLVKNDPNKFCFLFEREGGRNKLEALIRSNTSDVIKELANHTLELYSQYKVARKT